MNQFTVSLWGDEAFSAILSMKSIPEIISIASRDTHPPFFNLLEHFWFIFFGTSEISIRSLVFILFLISVFFVYKIGESLWDKKTGVLAALLTALNPFFFAYAFEGRMYSLLAATIAASMYFFITKKWVFYVLATALALYSHHFAFFAVFVQGLWFLKEFLGGNRKTAVSIFKSFIAIGILYSPWLIPLYNQTKMVGSGFWLGKPTLKDFGLLLLKYLNFSLVLLLVRDWRKKLGKSIFILMWFLVPILTVWILSQKFQSIFSDRYLLYTIPAAMLLAASQRTIITKIFLFVVFAVFISADAFYFTHPFKRPFRDLAIYVKETKKGDDYLINWNSTSHHLWESKYYGIGSPLYIPKGVNLPFFVGTALMTKNDTISSVPAKIDSKKTNRVGVITSGPVDEVNVPGYTKGEVHQFGDLKFIWLNK
ncbi:hypothetical protein A2210_02690 [Candidatus Woesebacteria bacterium RIFOXYA1_FULL_40_18]|uniref:Glycosyltransferase RgtA/B/C/D-like domain-containing protein n=4 Tax=Candidatus Woeseibacteriota TaxID=1752722 RepID=A0A1F8CME7_9BACT|nr:MAG: hypothetical protein UT72_C0007G0009 [Candidatus Woesebacteria bacterium GW2011_GWB1_40_101]OGM77236.1 MAG: hypothetical protein A2210_02690 [Candidatus Woesebacteria bacterium RIFOXYA1_FULL_40_18]OGM81231.1 MAG: hypothetical protein A2361_02700 [Candidatus Woesebacteria bacterium RIFOXYB1_FULL_40_26]OGM88113.1 MAG: hypothetical protein A2614_00790 [Candidatus Woesebacteria bacterium RIFOXYD1_FULL_40_21]